MRDDLNPARIWTARAIALVADCLEIAIFPAFAEGFFSPLNDIVDVVVALALISLVGWHWAFLPTFLAEMVPIATLVPTWTAAVFIATGVGPAATSVAPADSLPASPVISPTEPAGRLNAPETPESSKSNPS